MSRRHRGRRTFVLPAILGLAALVTLGAATSAGARSASGTTAAAAAGKISIVRGALTVESLSVGGIEGSGAVAQGPPRAVPFRPTVDADTYAELKRRAEASGPGRGAGTAGLDKAPKEKGRNFKGIDQTESPYRPPDTHAATGMSNIVEVSNTRISVWTKKGVRQSTATLNSFFNFTGPDIFDPRAVYDLHADRFIVSGVSFPESDGKMRMHLAFSRTGDGNGLYNKYSICCVDMGGGCWDYPQLGYDANAVIVTSNFFAASCNGGLIDARMFALPKAVGYTGGTFDPLDVFTGFPATLAPPIVTDNGDPYLISAGGFDTNLELFRCQNLHLPSRSCAARPDVTVPSYSAPPDAAQPGTSSRLDTLDARFVNSSYVQGTTLYNLHSILMGGRAGLRWYEVNTANSTVNKMGDTQASTTSYDWNASNAVNSLGEVFVTYSSTDPPNGKFPQVRITGRQPANSSMPKGKAAFTSPTFYTQGRWGDYSSVSLDPQGTNRCPAGRRAWAANEYAMSTTQWANRHVRIGFC
jgi:hypothetical protein